MQERLSTQHAALQQPLFVRDSLDDRVGNITTIRDNQRGREEYYYDAIGLAGGLNLYQYTPIPSA